MDTTRYETLTAKRDAVGLTGAEADELGRMIADLEGRTFNGHDAQITQGASSEQPSDPCAHVRCGCDVGEGVRYCSVHCSDRAMHPADDVPVVTCGCGHGACRAVTGES